jgi:hypothetical protein
MNIAAASHRFLIAGGVIALSACAAAPPAPNAALEAANIAVANADKDQGADYAPVEMRSAHEKLAEARESAAKPDDEAALHARRLADEARADADLASAKARLARVDAVNQQLQKDNGTLRQETQRGSGG